MVRSDFDQVSFKIIVGDNNDNSKIKIDDLSHFRTLYTKLRK